MNVPRDFGLLGGRVCLAALFLWGGFVKLRYAPGVATYLEALGVPGAGTGLAVALGAVELAGGLALLVGWLTRPVALALVLYLIPVTWYAHLKPAHAAADPLAKDHATVQTLKSAAVAGGLLLLHLGGPGAHAFDRRRR